MAHKLGRGLSTLIALGVVAFVGSATASDDKVFNGSMCTFTKAGQYNGQDRESIKLVNDSGQMQNVGCPLKRDRATSAVLEAYIIASAKVDEDSCLFLARGNDLSFSTWTHNNVVSTTSGVNKTTFGYGTAKMDPGDFATFQITCDVPDGSGVYSYFISEE